MWKILVGYSVDVVVFCIICCILSFRNSFAFWDSATVSSSSVYSYVRSIVWRANRFFREVDRYKQGFSGVGFPSRLLCFWSVTWLADVLIVAGGSRSSLGKKSVRHASNCFRASSLHEAACLKLTYTSSEVSLNNFFASPQWSRFLSHTTKTKSSVPSRHASRPLQCSDTKSFLVRLVSTVEVSSNWLWPIELSSVATSMLPNRRCLVSILVSVRFGDGKIWRWGVWMWTTAGAKGKELWASSYCRLRGDAVLSIARRCGNLAFSSATLSTRGAVLMR